MTDTMLDRKMEDAIYCRGLWNRTQPHDRLIPREGYELDIRDYALRHGWRRVVRKKRLGVVWFCPECAAKLEMVNAA